ncbi:MAG TPA: pyridoxine 5'-phosphate oxidase C-terminal domain-containing protein, partial [Bacteroidia bacterium]|nr:pyridoxine 5'-phosphate oxidase C-terminal domain-containing protein [Bacteroidia bacterium]
FSKRPWGSRIAALTSEQSTVITHREDLETRYNELADHYRDKDPIRPPHWGGYRLLPESVEFWQGRSNRLHDRLKYIKSGEGWRLVRLAP